MEEKLYIEGGFQLNGEINAMGAKNAALPLLAATLLTPSPCILKRVPKITDVSIMLALLESLGAKTVQEENKVKLCAKKISSNADSYTLIKSLRASFLVLAPLLARLGKAKVGVPGGDIIGARPINLHLEGLSKLGADLKVRHGYVEGKVLGKRLKGAHISLSYPSVGATHQILMAASLAKGTTVLEGAAKEPEVENLVKMLTIMGAEIEVEKPGKFIIKGKEELQGANLSLIGDRIEAATYLLAGAITRGKVLVKGINPFHLNAFLNLMNRSGAWVDTGENWILINCQNTRSFNPLQVKTSPYPGFPTDLQAALMAFLATVKGKSSIKETVFEGRFSHVSELCRLGAKITVSNSTAYIEGTEPLTGAEVEAGDIRAGAALVLAGLCARGTTIIGGVKHLRRGYENLEDKLRSLGANIKSINKPDLELLLVGC